MAFMSPKIVNMTCYHVSTSADFLSRYRFFRAQGSMRVGYAAVDAMDLARAEQTADERGWTFELEGECESYKDVYGEDPPAGEEFYCVVAFDDDHDVIGSLGFCSGGEDYFRQVAAELYLEAIQTSHAPGRTGATCNAIEVQSGAT